MPESCFKQSLQCLTINKNETHIIVKPLNSNTETNKKQHHKYHFPQPQWSLQNDFSLIKTLLCGDVGLW